MVVSLNLTWELLADVLGWKKKFPTQFWSVLFHPIIFVFTQNVRKASMGEPFSDCRGSMLCFFWAYLWLERRFGLEHLFKKTDLDMLFNDWGEDSPFGRRINTCLTHCNCPLTQLEGFKRRTRLCCNMSFLKWNILILIVIVGIEPFCLFCECEKICEQIISRVKTNHCEHMFSAK